MNECFDPETDAPKVELLIWQDEKEIPLLLEFI
jgi:hypothetical protein